MGSFGMANFWANWRDRWPLRAGKGAVPFLEALIWLVLVVQAARLFWALVTPVGVIGDWKAPVPVAMPPAARQSLFGSYDPFSIGAEQGQSGAQVTSLSLTLYGIRVNEGTGGGSAIIAGPDGVQSSYGVGDEVIPGVILKAVAYDHVVLDRGGAAESLYLDQSDPVSAPVAGPVATDAVPPGDGPLTPAMLMRDVGFAPRLDNGKVTGIIVTQNGADGFAKAGFQPGDIIVQVDGQPIGSAGDVKALQGRIKPGGRVALSVERNGAVVPTSLVLGGGN